MGRFERPSPQAWSMHRLDGVEIRPAIFKPGVDFRPAPQRRLRLPLPVWPQEARSTRFFGHTTGPHALAAARPALLGATQGPAGCAPEPAQPLRLSHIGAGLAGLAGGAPSEPDLGHGAARRCGQRAAGALCRLAGIRAGAPCLFAQPDRGGRGTAGLAGAARLEPATGARRAQAGRHQCACRRRTDLADRRPGPRARRQWRRAGGGQGGLRSPSASRTAGRQRAFLSRRQPPGQHRFRPDPPLAPPGPPDRRGGGAHQSGASGGDLGRPRSALAERKAAGAGRPGRDHHELGAGLALPGAGRARRGAP